MLPTVCQGIREALRAGMCRPDGCERERERRGERGRCEREGDDVTWCMIACSGLDSMAGGRGGDARFNATKAGLQSKLNLKLQRCTAIQAQ